MKNIEKIYPAQMCKEIAEKTNGISKLFVTSPTKIDYINPSTNGIYSVEKMNGSSMRTFNSLEDAINYTNSINNSTTIIRIGIKLYRHSTYTILAEIYQKN